MTSYRWRVLIGYSSCGTVFKYLSCTGMFLPKVIAKTYVTCLPIASMSQNVPPSIGSSRKCPSEGAVGGRDSQTVTKRLQSELMRIVMLQSKDISAFPEGDNLFKWIGTIVGPKDTVYENLTYKLSLEFPVGYPYSPPIVKFLTPCFHPNVDNSGNICLDILKDKWSALYDTHSILLSIQSLLGEPNNMSPLNAVAAGMWSNPVKFRKHLEDTYQKEPTK